MSPFLEAVRPLRGEGVVVAVSGGADSVALLRLLAEVAGDLQMRLSVAHLDHGTRGEASRADAAFVADLAANLAIPMDLGRWSPSRSGHFESDARAARYAWLAQTARQREARFVAVGHTRDDQAETILHRIVRGTGVRGLAGMPPRRSLGPGVTLVRPVLDVARSALREFLSGIGQPFREDASNADLSRTRNKIRHDLLPQMAADYNPRVVEALVNLGRIAGEARATIDVVAASAVREANDREIVLDVQVMQSFCVATRAEVLRWAWRTAGWPERAMTARHWRAMARLADAHEGRITTAYAVDVVRQGDAMRLNRPRKLETEIQPPVRLAVPGSLHRGACWITASLDEELASQGERLDWDQIAPFVEDDGGPCLEVRSPRDGDRFDPLGLEGRSQPLNDFFRGRGVARDDRRSVPLVCDSQGIVLVVGHRIAHRVRVTETTRRVLLLATTS